MDCPKCENDMEILDYQEDNSSIDVVYQEWECKCPNCGYKGLFSRLYGLIGTNWNDLD